MGKAYVVYVHINKVNGKRYYGITCQRPEQRWRNGDGYKCGYFTNAINKYGWDGFDHIIIASGLTEDEAKWLEVEMRAAHNTTNEKYGYNKTLGGDGASGLTGEKHPMYGKHLPEEHRRKISKALKGKTITEETRQKFREVNRGKNNPKAHSTICITTGKIFFTLKEAAEYYNASRSSISLCCQGKKKSAGKLPDGTKLVWRYVNYKHNKTYRVA